MDAVLEPFPTDRLFPGSSFLDLGDLNESDFLNNAVREKGLPHFPLCPNSALRGSGTGPRRHGSGQEPGRGLGRNTC